MMRKTFDIQCAVNGCTNGHQKLTEYQHKECPNHRRMRVADCPCPDPFTLFTFPSDASGIQSWLLAINRPDLTPNKLSAVCSIHFVDSGPTKQNPNPTLYLHGYDDEASNRHLRKLAFRNPGRFMEDFDPERSGREMRKMNRRIYSEKTRRNFVYDEEGRLLTDGRDLCDCLNAQCPGCHFPCPKCRSEKCGAECRSNRRWYYQELEIEGANHKYLFDA